jgi:hypothetical protein
MMTYLTVMSFSSVEPFHPYSERTSPFSTPGSAKAGTAIPMTVIESHTSKSIGSIEREARAALAAFYNALKHTTSYFGWPTTIVETLEAKIEAFIPTFFKR